MNLQEELKVAKERIAELEEQVKEEQEFPQSGDDYWYIDDEGDLSDIIYTNHRADRYRQKVGNIYKTEDEAEFALEKLKVEAELRKFSTPFKEGENCNWFILWNTYEQEIEIDWAAVLVRQGTIHFESGKKVEEAIESVGKERIKKYIFGVED